LNWFYPRIYGYRLWFFSFVLTQAMVKCIIKQQECKGEEQLWVILVLSCMSEYLEEEYPEVLGSILGALKSIVNVIGVTKMTPLIKE